jgi:hypothetical protein
VARSVFTYYAFALLIVHAQAGIDGHLSNGICLDLKGGSVSSTCRVTSGVVNESLIGFPGGTAYASFFDISVDGLISSSSRYLPAGIPLPLLPQVVTKRR